MIINTSNYRANEIFKFIRQNTDLTQNEFGQKIGKSEETIKKYENGSRKYDFKLLIEIANIFNLKIIIKDKTNKYKIIISNTNNHPEMIFKQIKDKLNLTYDKISKFLNKNISSITRYCNGSINYNFELLLLIAKEFDLEIIIMDKDK